MPKAFRVMPYDVKKPHKTIISAIGKIILQNGQAYEYGSGKHLGAVKDVLVLSKESKDNILLEPTTGATFPNSPDGKEQLKEYCERKGIGRKAVKNDEIPESSLEERKAEVKANRRRKNAE